ncbi:MAG TPA: glycerophosphodiester phosphodiesterase [Fluviicoccus sp.]|nr:glycerophosphodiester phosphodiesterase [Fluviicoccus sp.]
MDILGHRGARGEAPENTLSGFQHLLGLGIQAVEFDIQVSADQQLVIIHDRNVDRTTSASGPVSSFTAHQLSALDACHHRRYFDADNHRYWWPHSDGIPRLQDVLNLFPTSHHLQLEVKAATEADSKAVIRLLPAICREFKARAVTTSFNLDYLEGIRAAAPEIPRGVLFEQDCTGGMVETALALGCVSIGPHFSLCSRELVAQAHAAGLTVSTWTVNEPDDMRVLRDMGVDSIITDFPQLALRTLR